MWSCHGTGEEVMMTRKILATLMFVWGIGLVQPGSGISNCSGLSRQFSRACGFTQSSPHVQNAGWTGAHVPGGPIRGHEAGIVGEG